MGFDSGEEGPPEFAGAVVAHVGDEEELGVGDELGGALAAAGVDQGVVEAVDHQGRDDQGAQRVGAGARQDHRAELAAEAGRVVGAVVAAGGEVPDRGRVGVAPR